MAIVAHAEQNEVEPALAELIFQHLPVFYGGCVWLDLAAHAMDVLGWDRHLGEKRLVRHAEVAVGVIAWDAALVAEENVDLVPIKGPARIGGLAAREHFVKQFRRASAG